MILIAGGIADKVTELVCARLDDCGYPYRLFDLGRFPNDYGLTMRWADDGRGGCLTGPDWRLEIEAISGAYVRFLGPEGRVLDPGLPEAQARELQFEADTALMIALDDLPCRVVNRTGGGMSNNSKPHQIQLIARAGLQVPPTLVTNDPAAVEAFHRDHGQLIYKSASGIRSIVRRLDAGHMARLDLLRHGPAQFQALVRGCDVRVHTVGEQLFATRVRSDATDYRYAGREGATIEMEPAELPAEIAAACRRVTRNLGLLHGGIDLRQTPEGAWYCFEVNPCPGFLFYERNTGQPISRALAELLRDGAAAARPERAIAQTADASA